MDLIAYSIGLSLAPTLVGYFLGLGFIRIFFKMKLVKYAKWISYVLSVAASAIVVANTVSIDSGTNVVVGTTLGFLVTVLIAYALRKKRRHEEDK